MPTPRLTGPLLGAFGIAVTAALAAGGAAADGSSLWLGLPRLGSVAAIVAAVVGLALVPGCRARLPVAAGLGVVILPLVAGLPFAGVRALSGPPLAALALAGVALVVAGAVVPVRRRLFLPLAFALLVLVAGRSHVTLGPQGDEPHYLMVADSLLRDFDLSLERDYAEGRYAAFHDVPLAPHFRVRGRVGAESTRCTRWASRS